MGCALCVGNLFILYVKNNHFVYKFNSMYVKYIDEYNIAKSWMKTNVIAKCIKHGYT